MQPLQEVVDSDIGVGANENGEGNLPMQLEELDCLDDNAGLALFSSVMLSHRKQAGLTVPGGCKRKSVNSLGSIRCNTHTLDQA